MFLKGANSFGDRIDVVGLLVALVLVLSPGKKPSDTFVRVRLCQHVQEVRVPWGSAVVEVTVSNGPAFRATYGTFSVAMWPPVLLYRTNYLR